MKQIRVVIIDDERSGRSELRRLATRYPDLEIVGEARDAEEARETLARLMPDLIFLDIQMPGKSGFELLESLQSVPRVIFVTAFDQYALKAFEVSALDYLLKPVREERFAKAIEQVRKRLSENQEPAVFVKDKSRYYFLPWKIVHLVESLDNYARLYFGDRNVLIKSSLNRLEKQLAGYGFFRANRAQLINKNFIKEIIAISGGQAQILLRNNEPIEFSERQWINFKKTNTDK
ncbi:response regulator [Mucilaginibacter sp. 21P]|uniref:LytR/AlgR family response regulator transcription factor n=1 Tax=Mucilaginibacter sp. 21P TaxID=2778902 RepID=UPI001C5635F8|nr:response regulator [Mucilaginibacter sp. 21P]QXV63761.1 response regulator [Mucilaginibacter sp. 21P]